jgi:Protein of unknown function (DUF1552)
MQLSPRASNRRFFLRASGVGLALPLLDAFLPRPARAASASPPRRFVAICTSLGLHSPFLHPQEHGTDYQPSLYLKLIDEHRPHYTLLDGISHPNQNGNDGHASAQTWLTAAQHPGMPGFSNSMSIDQVLAEKIRLETRYPSLQLSTDGSSQSYTSSGIMIPGENSPSRVFAKLFLDGTAEQRAAQLRSLQEGRSVLDMLQAEAKRVAKRVGQNDRQKLQEYYESIREMERRMSVSEAWVNKPRPQLDVSQPQDVSEAKDLIGQMQLLFELIPLALQTDSTRLISVMIQGRNDVPPIPGVSVDHHNLSHHGQDEDSATGPDRRSSVQGLGQTTAIFESQVRRRKQFVRQYRRTLRQ